MWINHEGDLCGDLENLCYAGQTVQGLIHDRLPVSARLGIQQVVLGVTVGLLLGILAAMKRGTIADYLVIALSVLLISIPHLVSGFCFRRYLPEIFSGSRRSDGRQEKICGLEAGSIRFCLR